MKIKNIESYKLALLTSYAHNILSLVASIFITRHIFKFFDNAEYGVFILVVESIMVFQVLDFGFTGGMLSFLSRELDNIKRINKIVSTLFYAQVIISLIATAIAFSLILNPSLLFQNVDVDNAVLKNTIVIAAFSLFITMITKSISSVLYARRKIAGNNFANIITLVIRFGSIFILLERYPTIEFLIVLTLLTQLINFFQSFYLVKKLEPQINFSLKHIDFNTLKEVWKISVWFAIGGFSTLFIERFDNILTGTIISVQAITILVITRKFFEIAKSFVFQFNNNYRPYFGKMLGQGEHIEALYKFRNLSLISVFLTCLVGGSIVLFNGWVIEMWVGLDKYGGLYLSLLLFLNLSLHAWKITYRAFLSSNLIVKELAISSSLEGLFNLLLAYFLGLRYGINGIVASTFISGFIVQFTAFLYIFRKYSIEILSDFIKRNIAQMILVLLTGYIALVIATHIDMLVLRGLLWLVVMSFKLFVFIKIFFKEYTIRMVVKGKII